MNIRAILSVLVIGASLSLVGCFPGVRVAATRSQNLPPAPGLVLMSANQGEPWAFATDVDGKVRWNYAFESHSGSYQPQPIQPLPNGNLIVVAAHESGIAPCSHCPARNAIYEIDVAGNTIWHMTNQQLQAALAQAGYKVTLAQISHETIGLTNGHLLVLASNLRKVPGHREEIQGAVIIDLDQDHRPVWVWDAFDHLDVNRHPYFKLPDWIHGNAITYSRDDGNLLFSTRHQSWVIKIDYQNGRGSGAVLWRLGYEGDFKLLNGGPADWFYGQHAPIFLTPNTTGVFQLGLFDNGNGRVVDASGAHCGTKGQPACYSTIPIFEIDEAHRTARVVWRDTLPFFSLAVGNMQVLDNGNVWFNAGDIKRKTIIREVTRETPPQTVLEMRVNTIIYRAIHLPEEALRVPPNAP